MLKKTLTYKDLDGNEITEDFYFNISKDEIAVLELSMPGGFSAHFQRIMEASQPDGAYIMKTFRDLIAQSVGRRSEDNKSFLKGDTIRDAFMYSDAYTVLFMELVTEADKAAEFFKGVMPKDLQEQLEKLEAENAKAGNTPTPIQNVSLPAATSSDENVPSWITEDRVPTEAELKNATPDQLKEAFRRKGMASGG
jgi:hypothetical protein